jgi:hypothetical protein
MRKTLRMGRSQRNCWPGRDGRDAEQPRQSAFVAAGFLIAHASIIREVPFDPFMPFLFMGEEIALSARLWTAGFDIYAPTDHVVSHDYGRHDAPKFWETIDMVFGSRGTYNELNSLLIQRVQHLVGWQDEFKEDDATTEDTDEDSIEDEEDDDTTAQESVQPSLFVRLPQFGLGNVRSGKDFAKFMGLDWINQRQEVPEWCIQGAAPPWAGQP